MGVDPKILQQYVDDYNQQAEKWKRKASTYNKALDTYNEQVATWNTQNTNAYDAWKAAVDKYNADDMAYLNANPDVYNAVALGQYKSGWDHYSHMGYKENRGGVPADWGQDAAKVNAAAQQLFEIERSRPAAPSAGSGLFNEKLYLANNPDVAAAVANGQFKTGWDHYVAYGYKENRNAANGGAEAEKQLQAAAAWQNEQYNQNYNAYTELLKNARVTKAQEDPNLRALREQREQNEAALNSMVSGGADPAETISAAYRLYLGRDPDQAGLDYWAGAVNAGTTDLASTVNMISSSDEAKAYSAANPYMTAKAPTETLGVTKEQLDAARTKFEAAEKERPGFDWFTGQKTPGRVTNALASGDPNKIVQATYSAYLGRQPEASGMTYWADQIKAGTLTPQQAITAIRQSEEGKTYGSEWHGKAPSFTTAQQNAMSGQSTGSSGLIAGERINAAAERESPSLISGILARARNQRS